MPHDQLAIYLNDHLAGSVVAIRLMQSIEDSYGDQERTREIADIVGQVRRDVEADRAVLETLLAGLGTNQSTVRKAAGWFAERFAQVKLAADGDDAFRLLEATEVVVLGLLGKRGLWQALESAADIVPAVQGLDFDALLARAESQYARMEVVRRGAARAALGDAHG